MLYTRMVAASLALPSRVARFRALLLQKAAPATRVDMPTRAELALAACMPQLKQDGFGVK